MRGVAVLAFVLVACSAEPSVSAASPAPNPRLVSSVCMLPVLKAPPGMSDEHSESGFVTIPGGAYSVATDAVDGTYYDRALRRWVPLGPPDLSADGLRYAYMDSDKVHLRDVRSGADRVLGSIGPSWLVGIDDKAAYMTAIDSRSSFTDLGDGLWEIPFDGQPPVKLSADAREWVWVSDGAVYGGAKRNAGGRPNDIVRFDVRTKRASVWFDKGLSSSVMGVDQHGNGFVLTESDTQVGVWRVTARGEAIEIWSGDIYGAYPIGPAEFDGSDVWLSGSFDWGSNTSSIYHWSAGAGLKRVATFPDYLMLVAGSCV